MAKEIKYYKTKDKLIITILPIMKPIIVFGIIFQGIIVIGLSAFFIIIILQSLNQSGFWSIAPISIIVSVLYFFVGRAYLNRVFYKQTIEVSKDVFKIIDQYIIYSKDKEYSVNKIEHLHYVGREKFTPHPLANKTLDPTGLSVTENEVQYLIEDGTIEFTYDGSQVRFGKNIPSWDAEEVIDKIEKFQKEIKE